MPALRATLCVMRREVVSAGEAGWKSRSIEFMPESAAQGSRLPRPEHDQCNGAAEQDSKPQMVATQSQRIAEDGKNEKDDEGHESPDHDRSAAPFKAVLNA